MDEEELTPIQASRAATGKRFHAISNESVYQQMQSAVDQIRGFPHGAESRFPTVQGLQDWATLPVLLDGRRGIALECWRFSEADDAVLAPAIEAGLIEELTAEDFAGLR